LRESCGYLQLLLAIYLSSNARQAVGILVKLKIKIRGGGVGWWCKQYTTTKNKISQNTG